jgi:hypothetical protein
MGVSAASAVETASASAMIANRNFVMFSLLIQG